MLRTSPHRSCSQNHRAAFTLVELLVVIGIIALLIALLLPSLGIARQQAQRVACEAKLHNIMVAAQLHANEHQGYYPLAGVIPGWQPSDLEDNYSKHYSYLSSPADPNDFLSAFYSPYIAPITIALASQMSFKQSLQLSNNTDLGTAETDPHGFIQLFLCPSHGSSIADLPPVQPMLYSGAKDVTVSFTWGTATGSLGDIYWEQQSYNFNEAVLGWSDQYTTGRLKGKAVLIRQPAKTMFACDGLMGSIFDSRYPFAQGNGMATLYNISQYPPVTMADAYLSNGIAGDTENFDIKRHRGKINIACCDGHVETRTISASDLQNIFLLAP